MIKNNIFRGFNGTILAYGQTGSGKTYTMGTSFGQSSDGGIIPRSVEQIFKTADEFKGSVTINLSYLEIYNEEVKDLLSDAQDDAQDLTVREGIDGSVTVQNLTYKEVKTSGDVGDLMSQASLRRATAATQMNAVSSRSHAICTLYIVATPSSSSESTDGAEPEQISSKFTLVDLAGSERAKRTGAEGTRLKEGININKGLFVLGQVIR